MEKMKIQGKAMIYQDCRVSQGCKRVLLLVFWIGVQGLGDMSPVDSGQTLQVKCRLQPWCEFCGLCSQ